MKMYVFPAIFTKDDNSYIVDFIDLKGCSTEGKNIEEAYKMAQDAMGLYLYDLSSNEFPKPTIPYNNISLKSNEFITLISLDLDDYRKNHNNISIKKTLSIPMWLNTIAEKANVNFSQVLQEALKIKLNLK